MTKFWLF